MGGVPGGRTAALLLGPATAILATAVALTLPPVAAGPASPAAAATPATDAARPVRIMPLGDSITLGIGTATRDSYRRDLFRRLTAAGLSVDFVGSVATGTGADPDHEGHPGWTIVKVRRSIDRWMRTHRPDVVLLHLGTNDMRTRDQAVGAPDRMAALLRRITALRPTARILVARLIGAGRPSVQRRIDAFNAALPAVVAAAGPRVQLVDQSTVDGLSLRDNLHPNDFGAAQMAWNWHRALSRTLRVAGPAGRDPHHARRAFLCRLVATHPGGGPYVGKIRCAWYRRADPHRRWVPS